MRGLRPWPFGVGQLQLEYDVDGAPATIGFWFLDPSGASADASTCESIADQFILSGLGVLTEVTTRAARASACTVTIRAVDYARARVQFDPVEGIWSGAQAMNSTCGWRLVGLGIGGRRPSVVRLPSAPDDFVDSTWRLSASGYANLRDKGAAFIDAFNAMTGAGGAPLQLGTLHRIGSGAALNPPIFDPAINVVPSPHLLTIRRRLPKGVQVSPT